jgi:hypothetical protein
MYANVDDYCSLILPVKRSLTLTGNAIGAFFDAVTRTANSNFESVNTFCYCILYHQLKTVKIVTQTQTYDETKFNCSDLVCPDI